MQLQVIFTGICKPLCELKALLEKAGLRDGWMVGMVIDGEEPGVIVFGCIELFARKADAERALAALSKEGLGTLEAFEAAEEKTVLRIIGEAMAW